MNKEQEKQLALNTIRVRNKVIELIKNKYTDFPKILHEKNGDGTGRDLVIDEIAWYVLREYIGVHYE